MLDTSRNRRRISKGDAELGPLPCQQSLLPEHGPRLSLNWGVRCHPHAVRQCRVLEGDAVLCGLGSAR